MGILEDLLARGHFPVQLPPAFTSESAASNLAHYASVWDAGKEVLTRFEKFSVPRSSYYRRGTAVLNPIGYYRLCRQIARYWPEIQKHYQQSQLSRSVPTFGVGGIRAIHLPKYSELYEDKIKAAAGHRYALVTDITSFFPSLYTHAISWALHTKPIAKVKKGKKHATPAYFGNLLDEAARATQDGQTVGVAVGPDTSHVLAELIGVAVDVELQKSLGTWPSGFRYVDDFFLFFDRREEAERALAAVTNAVGHFELQINAAKTRIIEVKELVEESWKYTLKRLTVSSAGRRQQRDDIHHYFEALFALEKRFKDESLIKYGLKQLSSTIVKASNWQIMEAYLLKCGYGFPNAIQVIAHLLATYHHHGYPVNKDVISRFCANLLSSGAASNHHGEVAWLLWICKELHLDVQAGLVADVQRIGSPVCTLLLLDLHHSGIVGTAPNVTLLKHYATKDALEGAGWLLAYEAGRRQWLGVAGTDFIDTHAWFGALRKAGVMYYDEGKKLPPIFDFKTSVSKPEDFDFDAEAPIEQSFQFDEMDEEYFDSASLQDEETDSDTDQEEMPF
ncbi:hypothetical protein BURK2_01728 [Burkholderiales bacterium]|nr:hypothetical protein BURK2_01728 [Burkholderiales bacterium]